MAADRTTTADHPARQTVTEQLARTLFLEAGAGSGKTTCLVDRFVALVESGVPADHIAAITFTEKAAAELADRIRAEMQRRSERSGTCRSGLEDLDRAAIGTLHSFAQRILAEFPIEAGLPPRIEVLDEITSQIHFESRWSEFVDSMLEDPDLDRPLRLLLAAGGRLDHLHQVAGEFAANWDLVAARHRPGPTPVPDIDLSAVLEWSDEVERLRSGCREPGDLLQAKAGEVAEWADRLRRAAAGGDEEAVLDLLGCPLKAGNVGKAANWPDVAEVKAAVRRVAEAATRVRDAVLDAALGRVGEEIARFTVATADERRRSGRLEFHDLLVLARAALRQPGEGPVVRRRLAGRYERLLLDEFQDTDPIQIEIAVLIASADPDAGRKEWHEIIPEPGRLFFVGDPKQSIYRFRRADISMFLQARDTVGQRVEHLTANFRTAAPILQWVNHTFEQLIDHHPGSQPAYVALQPVRPAAPVGPAVALIGAAPQPAGSRADDLREAEAASVAASVAAAVKGGWSVEENDGGGWRPCRWSDVAVLLPARTSLRALERAFESAGIPYRAETSSLVYGTGEIRDLLMVARAVEDPTDSLAVVAALRSGAFGCGDDDLYRWRHTYGGRWDHQAARPGGVPAGDVVAAGLDWMSALHRERRWLSPSQVLDRVVRDRRLLELAFVTPRPRDLWRRIRFVVDQCRAWEEAGGTTLRDYLAWVRLQSAEGSRVVETVLPETDDQAVRILTVHRAKGLEFPVTVLSGMTTRMIRPGRGVQVLFPPGDGWALRLKDGLQTAEFSDLQPIEEQMDRHERIRLLYVAATRARDHLIVSVHHKEGGRGDTSAEVMLAAGGSTDLATRLEPEPLPVPSPAEAEEPPAPGPGWTGLADWESEWSKALDTGRRPVAVSATRLAEEAAATASSAEVAGEVADAEVADGLRKEPTDLELPPWQKGRYGSAIGRAVHAVLQSVDLGTGEGLVDHCAGQAAAEGVMGREPVIEALCRSALQSPIIGEAAGRPHYREMYVGVPYGDGVLEGYIDLLYRDDDGLVIVDYKTDSWRTGAELDAKVDRYRVQMDAYRHAVAEITGEPQVRAALLFLRAGAPAVTVAVE